MASRGHGSQERFLVSTPDYTSLREPYKRLKKLKASRDIAGLMSELRSSEHAGGEFVRARAARYLGDLNVTEAVDPLISMLNDGESGVRTSAAIALGQIGSPAAVRPLLRALDDPDPWVKARAIGSLGEIGREEAIPELERLLDDPSWIWVRAPALYALLLIPSDRASEIARVNLAGVAWWKRRALYKDVRRQKRRRRLSTSRRT